MLRIINSSNKICSQPLASLWNSQNTCLAFLNKSISTYLNVPNVSKVLPTSQVQQRRNVFILKRKYKLNPTAGFDDEFKLRDKDQVYQLIENTDRKKIEPLRVILLNHVEGIGARGNIVDAVHSHAHEAILAGDAVYASPENITRYAYLSEGDQSSAPSSKHIGTIRKWIEQRVIVISMNLENPWEIEPWHVQLGLRKCGIICPAEAVILNFPRPIKGPNLDLENKEFTCTLQINKKDELPLRCRIHHVSTDLRHKLPHVSYFWHFRAEPVFPEHAETLNMITSMNKTTRDDLPH